MAAADNQVGISIEIEIEKLHSPATVHLRCRADAARARFVGERKIVAVAVNRKAFPVEVTDE